MHQAYSKQSESITVVFGEVSGASSYILRAQTLDGEFFSETEVSDSPGTVINLQPYITYSLSVMSVNTGGRSQPSLPVVTRTGTVDSKGSQVLCGIATSQLQNTFTIHFHLNVLLSSVLFELNVSRCFIINFPYLWFTCNHDTLRQI